MAAEKLKKAEQLGISIIAEEDLMRMIEDTDDIGRNEERKAGGDRDAAGTGTNEGKYGNTEEGQLTLF